MENFFAGDLCFRQVLENFTVPSFENSVYTLQIIYTEKVFSLNRYVVNSKFQNFR